MIGILSRIPALIGFLFTLLLSVPVIAAETAHNPAEVVVDAERMYYDKAQDIIYADGGVVLYYDHKVLTTEKVEYFVKTDRVIAIGAVKLVEASGDILYASSMELEDKFSRGVAEFFRAEIAKHAYVISRQATRESQDVFVLKDTSYSACGWCDDDKAKHLPWRIRSKRSTIDFEKEVVTHRHMWLETFGHPIFYTPYFAHPTPKAQPKSGILQPKYGTSSEFGTSITLPYYFRIAPHIDATVTPTFYSQENPLVKGEYRHRFTNGLITVRNSFIHSKTTPESFKATIPETRWHFFSQGNFVFEDQWHGGFDLKRSSDQTYVKKFFSDDSSFLESRLYLQRLSAQNMFQMRLIGYQGLREGDSAATMPLLLPLVDHHIENEPEDDAPILALDSNMMLLHRDEGVESRRVSLKGSWKKQSISSGGLLWHWANSMRVDGYDLANSQSPVPGQTFSGQRARAIPATELGARLPLVSSVFQRSVVIEPIAMIYMSPTPYNPQQISNQDTALVALTPDNLFKDTRFNGLDIVEGGVRSSYGMRFASYNEQNLGSSILVGQHYHVDTNPTLYAKGSGMDRRFSDYVARFHVKPLHPIDLLYRVRLDKDTGAIQNNQFSAILTIHPFAAQVSYTGMMDPRNPSVDTKYLTNALQVMLKHGWKAELGSELNLKRNQVQDTKKLVKMHSKLFYNDDCYQLGLLYQRNLIRYKDVKPETFIGITINLRTLNYNE